MYWNGFVWFQIGTNDGIFGHGNEYYMGVDVMRPALNF